MKKFVSAIIIGSTFLNSTTLLFSAERPPKKIKPTQQELKKRILQRQEERDEKNRRYGTLTIVEPTTLTIHSNPSLVTNTPPDDDWTNHRRNRSLNEKIKNCLRPSPISCPWDYNLWMLDRLSVELPDDSKYSALLDKLAQHIKTPETPPVVTPPQPDLPTTTQTQWTPGPRDTMISLVNQYIGGADMDSINTQGQTALMIAAAQDDVERVTFLLNLKVDTTQKDHDGMDAFQHAISSNSSACAQRINPAKYDLPPWKDEYTENFPCLAVSQQFQLNMFSQDKKTFDTFKRTQFQIDLILGSLFLDIPDLVTNMCKYVAPHEYATDSETIMLQSVFRDTIANALNNPLIASISCNKITHNYPSTLSYIKSQCPNLNLSHPFNRRQDNILHLLTQVTNDDESDTQLGTQSDEQATEKLYALWAFLDTPAAQADNLGRMQNKDGETPLHTAINCAHVTVAERLLRNFKYSLSLTNNIELYNKKEYFSLKRFGPYKLNLYPLQLCRHIQQNDSPFAGYYQQINKEKIEQIATMIWNTHKENRRQLFNNIQQYNAAALTDVLAKGVDLEHCNNNGWETPLWYCVEKKFTDGVNILIAAGADTKKLNDEGKTMLDYAIEHDAPVDIITALGELDGEFLLTRYKKNNENIDDLYTIKELFKWPQEEPTQSIFQRMAHEDSLPDDVESSSSESADSDYTVLPNPNSSDSDERNYDTDLIIGALYLDISDEITNIYKNKVPHEMSSTTDSININFRDRIQWSFSHHLIRNIRHSETPHSSASTLEYAKSQYPKLDLSLPLNHRQDNILHLLAQVTRDDQPDTQFNIQATKKLDALWNFLATPTAQAYNLGRMQNKYGETPLHTAASYAHVTAAQRLLQHFDYSLSLANNIELWSNCSPFSPEQFLFSPELFNTFKLKLTPLELCHLIQINPRFSHRYGHLNQDKIKQIATMIGNLQTENRRKLFESIQKHDAVTLTDLLVKGVNLEQHTNNWFESPLWYCVESNFIAGVNILTAAGADTSQLNNRDQTMRDYAISTHKSPEIIAALGGEPDGKYLIPTKLTFSNANQPGYSNPWLDSQCSTLAVELNEEKVDYKSWADEYLDPESSDSESSEEESDSEMPARP